MSEFIEVKNRNVWRFQDICRKKEVENKVLKIDGGE